jgi:hypothetical protein
MLPPTENRVPLFNHILVIFYGFRHIFYWPGFDLIRRRRYDLILFDYLMPVMSGLEMLDRYLKWTIDEGVEAEARETNKEALFVGKFTQLF